MLPELPEVDYVGVDISAEYISDARRRHGGRGTFIVGNATRLQTLGLEPFEVVLMMGLLHHLDDGVAATLFETIGSLLRPGGRLIAVEPCRHPGQSWLERQLMARDRGRNVRTLDGYRSLVGSRFRRCDHVLVTDMLRIPWTHAVLTLHEPVLAMGTNR